MENSLLQLALRRRSVRRYTPGRISEEVLTEIVKVGLSAPASFGHKAVEFLVIRDPERIRSVGAAKTRGGSQINGADTVIVTMVKTEDPRQSELWIEDGAIASTYMMLAVEQYGLGACWVHIRNRTGQRDTSDAEIRALLGIPDGYTILNLLAIGEKGEEKSARTEADLDMGLVHYERF